ncbi:hypothetical protein [uncultured Desulfovibrio sp.]|uniref:hypothetical protein n=1 Tax=uncultured Desulfovibrio sp. TaxID=167968 RepID=UPI00261E450D|nr:hypothetical protein [uncultured Desulfovibrio sp.]
MDDLQQVQTAANVNVARSVMDLQANMAASLISGSLGKDAELQDQMARVAGLAAQGIGGNLNITA